MCLSLSSTGIVAQTKSSESQQLLERGKSQVAMIMKFRATSELEVQELVAKKLHRGAAKTILWVGHSAILKTHDWN